MQPMLKIVKNLEFRHWLAWIAIALVVLSGPAWLWFGTWAAAGIAVSLATLCIGVAALLTPDLDRL